MEFELERTSDVANLPEKYRQFHDSIIKFVSKDRVFTDPVRTFVYSVDASLYHLIPKIVIRTISIEEVTKIIKEAKRLSVPVTFRAAGTSLSGQAVSDSVLVVLSEGWHDYSITEGGKKITLQPGIIGSEANAYLKEYSRKIGPDPASIEHAMIGGMAANNASGMCCGTADNTYKTIEDIKLIFADGSYLDTADADSRKKWSEQHQDMIAKIRQLHDSIANDAKLSELIKRKFKIKNTTGYSLNAFVDYHDPIDIIKHVVIGSEGTLALIVGITYRTIADSKYKASALMIFKDMRAACQAVMQLSRPLVSAAELLDRESIRSVEDWPGVPSYLKEQPDAAAALLVEVRAERAEDLQKHIDEVQDLFKDAALLRPIEFTDNPAEYGRYWDVRAGIFPAVGGVRDVGTTVIIEDVAFPRDVLADAVMTLRKVMDDDGYEKGIIYGHTLDGNVHFEFAQGFDKQTEKDKYQKLIEDVVKLVVDEYHGSLKAEHGTGRNMAPFVEVEWGKTAYQIMKDLKTAFDPDGLLNPDVIITKNGNLYMENIKNMAPVHETVDKCMECGYCEAKCPSRYLTFTPRQRIVAQREMSHMRITGKEQERLRRFEEAYEYFGDETCAADGMCATVCPLSINTGDFSKHERSLHATPSMTKAFNFITKHWAGSQSTMRTGLTTVNAVHSILGSTAMQYMADKMHDWTNGGVPQWNRWMPKAGHTPAARENDGSDKPKVVYYPTCITRMMGPSKKDLDQRQIDEVILSLLKKAGYSVIIPKDIGKYCCGMPFESEGFFDIADRMSKQLETVLLKYTNNGEYPIVSDTSPCTYRMRHVMDKRLKIFDTVDFIHDYLLPRLKITKINEPVMLHITCSSRKMGMTDKFKEVGEACAAKVIVPSRVFCCGFAGNKGFTTPELNKSALTHLNEEIPTNCHRGYSNSRTCEVGCSDKSGFSYQSIAYLVDECSEAKA